MKYTRRNVYCYLKRTISFSEGFMSLCGIITLLMTVISLLVPCLYQVLVDRVMLGGDIQLLYFVIPAMTGVYLLKVILSGIRTYVDKKFLYATTLETKSCLMQKILARDLSGMFKISKIPMVSMETGKDDEATEKDVGAQSQNKYVSV